ncbi:hypothetical protein SBFV2_gp13 [Sulfolobales Beppu filamentous virus 2]|uniref:Uncharacterized protein n=1 Tax=Sulfolobales Beppu filamentous virus 2 TaxID=2493123 RepID=A0A3S8NEX3_9VIRU|nr:hypothetical protein HOU84_gp13 [Sulfolobales Beppu filamentous virus 2]AZI75780.1 hypothetical protein SBFV2_gp13 [Sulfolobales Beppu filamentous virus 2]
MKKVKLPETILTKIKGEILKPELKVRAEASAQGNIPSLSYQWVSSDEVEWVISNPTQQILYTAIWRNGYIFGSAFTEVYIRNGLTKIWTDPSQSTTDQEPYRIGLVTNPYYPTLAFVFKVPPGSTLYVPEYGFSQQEPPQDYRLITVTPGTKTSVLVAYDPMLPVIYMLQSQEPVLSMPSPYPLEVLSFNTNEQIQNPFIRIFYGYNFLTELILPILQ